MSFTKNIRQILYIYTIYFKLFVCLSQINCSFIFVFAYCLFSHVLHLQYPVKVCHIKKLYMITFGKLNHAWISTV